MHFVCSCENDNSLTDIRGSQGFQTKQNNKTHTQTEIHSLKFLHSDKLNVSYD